MYLRKCQVRSSSAAFLTKKKYIALGTPISGFRSSHTAHLELFFLDTPISVLKRSHTAQKNSVFLQNFFLGKKSVESTQPPDIAVIIRFCEDLRKFNFFWKKKSVSTLADISILESVVLVSGTYRGF